MAPLCALSSIRYVSISECGTIGDGAMQYLKRLKDLARLDLYSTPIASKGLAYLPEFQKLEHLGLIKLEIEDLAFLRGPLQDTLLDLSVCECSVKDAGLTYLQGLANLRNLILQNTNISDDSLPHIASCEKLSNLNLTATQVQGKGLRHLKDTPNLFSLILLNCLRMNDEGLAAFSEGGFEKLGSLELGGCAGITDAGLQHLKGLRNLRDLGLERTSVTKAGVESLRSALPGCDVGADFSSTQ